VNLQIQLGISAFKQFKHLAYIFNLIVITGSAMKRSFIPPKSPFHSFPVGFTGWNNKKLVPLEKLRTVPKRYLTIISK